MELCSPIIPWLYSVQSEWPCNGLGPGLGKTGSAHQFGILPFHVRVLHEFVAQCSCKSCGFCFCAALLRKKVYKLYWPSPHCFGYLVFNSVTVNAVCENWRELNKQINILSSYCLISSNISCPPFTRLYIMDEAFVIKTGNWRRELEETK